MKPWRLSEVRYRHVLETRYDVAVLPFGATEPHNLHLPYGTDCYEATTIGDRICQHAWEQGSRVLLLPTVPYGTETNMAELPLAMNLYPSTLGLIIRDLVESLVRSGIRKVLLLNSHGGNEFKPVLRELCGQTDAAIFLCNWYRAFPDRYAEIFEHADDHAGEMETSFMLAFHNELVGRNADGSLDADSGSPRPSRLDAVNQGWVSITRPWHLLTTHSGCGYPHEATAEKGQQLMELLVERLGGFLVELASAEQDTWFPFVGEPE